MKKQIIILTLVFHFTSIIAQQIDTVRPCLFVEKGDKLLQFKHNKYLNIRKKNGQGYYGKNYILLDKSIILFPVPSLKPDTLMLVDIKWIKGRTYGNEGRIFGGALLFAGGPAIGFYPIYGTAFGLGIGPALLMAIPFVAISVEGCSLMLPRKFNTSEKWELKIIKP
jgi:hypothetical protein